MTKSQRAILQTLTYSDLFDFPLTKEELWRFLKSDQIISHDSFEESLLTLDTIASDKGFYFLKNRHSLVQSRYEKEKNSQKKIANSKNVITALSLIPSILFIGISGSLAMNNANNDDDVDLFLITKQNTVWTTRIMALGVLEMFGMRRKKTTRDPTNTVCINMLIDEQNISFLPDNHDVYIAHEIAQLTPVFDRNNTYQQFLHANAWITGFMPNVKIPETLQKTTKKKSKISVVNTFVKYIQLLKINTTRTTEIVSDTILAFHPSDNRTKTLIRYKKIREKYKL